MSLNSNSVSAVINDYMPVNSMCCAINELLTGMSLVLQAFFRTGNCTGEKSRVGFILNCYKIDTLVTTGLGSQSQKSSRNHVTANVYSAPQHFLSLSFAGQQSRNTKN